MKKQLTEQDIPYLACGARYLGSGGGGDSRLLELLALRSVREEGPVTLLSPMAVCDEEWVVPVAIMGSPTILNEKLLTQTEIPSAINMLEKEKGITIGAVMGFEIGGMEAMVPVLAAALSKLPLLDCDGMGRAFSELQMTTFHAFGIQATPLTMVNDRGECHRIHQAANEQVEHEARDKVIEWGGSAAIAGYPMQGRAVREVAIHQTFSLAMRLGEAVKAAQANIDHILIALNHTFGNSIYGRPCKLIEGKIVDLQRNLVGGLLSGALMVEGTGFFVGEQMEVIFKNEYLLAKKGERALAMVPDLICILDEATGSPITIEELENHRKVWIIVIPSPLLLRDPKMLEIVGPKRFGLATEFFPTEQLQIHEGEEELDDSYRN
ncbi:DUF917 domain-containing protein [Aneurinibacillus sp. Ricciae_BoGa-3]|uniref:DUF917 domain-containing protein n=1 Tax=Aneurinibacillus sp. Ricciae_BoGa-3 TaxID=3022697 RepID=UPI00233FC7DF|nr:DUF917 domain-containing protein [Aneurinibacillus sp. Ricciae_BoGa-3]WCK52619.1 DUF917 domain-containing protein [Aneurinibacillus sp. Ricciae_BoGa-3]